MPRVGAGQGPLRGARPAPGMVRGGAQQGGEGVRAGCELAENVASRIGLQPGVRHGLASAFETWNGTGFPDGVAGETIPLSSRIVFVARDAEVLLRLGGADRVRAALAARSGAAYDPAVASTFLAYAEELLNEAGVESPWEAVLAREPEPHPWVPEVRLDATLEAFADFADLKSPFTAGHSRGVAARAAATSPGEAGAVRPAAPPDDLGPVAVPNGIRDKPA